MKEVEPGVSSVFMNRTCCPSAANLGYDYQYVSLGVPKAPAMSFHFSTFVMKPAIPATLTYAQARASSGRAMNGSNLLPLRQVVLSGRPADEAGNEAEH
jgi:hypothetical protein